MNTMEGHTTAHINKIIIHCAATPNGKAFNIVNVDQWHKERGFQRKVRYIEIKGHDFTWQKQLMNMGLLRYPEDIPCHVGYHYLIYVDGTIAPGRHIWEQGAHVRGYNAESIGICLIGTDKFTARQWQSLITLLYVLREKAGLHDAEIIGHRDLDKKKACPCFDVQRWIYSCALVSAGYQIWPPGNLLA